MNMDMNRILEDMKEGKVLYQCCKLESNLQEE